MEFRLASIDDLLKIWKKDFLGHQGFLIPGDRTFPLGRELTIHISIGNEAWGSATVLPVWSNLYCSAGPDLPRGTFLKVVRAEKSLQQRINTALA